MMLKRIRGWWGWRERERQSRIKRWDLQIKWGDLAAYNAECSRGIVHSPDVDARMAERQKRYNVEVLHYHDDSMVFHGISSPAGNFCMTCMEKLG